MISEKLLLEMCGVQILSSVLLWNFALSNQLNKLPSKVKKDFVPTLVNGEHSNVLCCAIQIHCHEACIGYQAVVIRGNLWSPGPGHSEHEKTALCQSAH